MSAEDLYRQAQQHAAADRHGEAVEAYSNALALDDGHWKARFGRAVALHRLGDLAAARQDFDRVMSDGPECAEAFYSRAAMRYDSGVFRATLEDCDTALRLKPGYTDALYLRLQCCSRRKCRLPRGILRTWDRLAHARALG